MGAAHLSASELNIKSEGNNKFIINDLLANYSYTDQSSASNTMVRPLGLKFDLMTGFGAGIDVGFVYEYRPGLENSYSGISQCDREMARTYRWKFGASLTDIGFISYDGSSYSVTAKNINYTAANVFQIDQMYGSNANPAVGQFDQMGNMASSLGSTPKSTFMSYTPMALNMQWDYRSGKWHLGAYWIHNLKPVDMPGLRRASTFSIVPRRQTERLEYGFPVSFVQNYSTLNVGAYLRVGPLIVGSNNLAGLGQFLNNSGTQSPSFYIGIRSKIGECSREVYDELDMGYIDSTVVDSAYVDVDSTVIYLADTVFIKDTIILRDTIVKTEVKTVIKRDTVVVTKNVNTTTKDPSVLQALNDCQKREADLKKRLTEIEAREAATNNKNKVCESDLQRWRAEAEKCKLESDRIKAESDKVKAESDRLKAENDRLKAVAITPVDKQAKRCDSLLLIELLKNQKLLVELADAKKATVDCNAKLLDALNRAKLCESELANEKNKSNQLALELANAKKQIESLLSDKKRLEDQLKAVTLGEDCTPYKNKIAELEKLLAAERLKTAQLTADLGNCNKSLESLKAQLAAEQTKVKNLEVKNSDCDKAKAALVVELEAAKKKVTELEEKLKSSSTGSDCSKTRDSLSQALLDLGIAKNAYDALMAEYQDCLKTSKSYRDQLKACEDKLAAGTTDASVVVALKAEIAKLKNTITELNGEVAAGKKSLDACQDALTEKETLIQSLQDQLKTKTSEISTLQSQLKAAQTQLNDVKVRLTKCEEEKANMGTSNEPTGTGTGTPGGGISPNSPGGN
jgi:predicted  nucleic acid-binding Zn-ribbon protein